MGRSLSGEMLGIEGRSLEEVVMALSKDVRMTEEEEKGESELQIKVKRLWSWVKMETA